MEATAKKIYAPNELACAVAIHTGRNAQGRIAGTWNVAKEKFAGIIGMPYTAFNEIINGKRSITTDTALKIEAATGIAATIWLGLQTDYNMQTARRDNNTFRYFGEHTQIGCGSLKDFMGLHVYLNFLPTLFEPHSNRVVGLLLLPLHP